MSNLTINRIGPEAQADSAWHDEDVEAQRFARLDVTPRARGSWGDVVVMCGLSLALAGVFYGAAWYTERQFPPDEGWLLLWRFLIVVFSLTPAALIALEAVARWRERQAYVARVRLARDRLMNPVPADMLAQMTPAEYIRILELHAALERDVAPHRAYRGVESLSISAPAAGRADAARAPEPPAPEAPEDPPHVWLDDVLALEAHLMLAGKTACGKTVTAEALLATAIDAGDHVLVIDPHGAPGKWHGVEAIGAGRDYEAIRRALRAIEDEMTRRYEALRRGEPAGGGALIIIDEVPSIAAMLGGDWKQFATRLGSEARKIGIRLLLITQSPLVQDVNINSVMKRNFGVLGLDLPVIREMLRDERDAAKKRAILDALEGERYPALYDRLGEFRILSRSGIQRIKPYRAPNVWRPSVREPASASETGALRTDGRADATLERLAALIRSGMTREEARAQGYEFANDDWTRARRAVEADECLRDLLASRASHNGLGGGAK